MARLRLLLCVLLPLSVFAQVGPSPTRRLVRGAALPATCRVGEIWFKTADTTVYVCTVANTWTSLSATGSDQNPGNSGKVKFGTRSGVSSPADSQILLQNNAANDFDLLLLGGTTNTFPAIKRNGTRITAKLADDSALAPVDASEVKIGPATEGACDATNRGRIVMTQGAAGVPDTVKICAKKTDNSYDWFAMATIP